MGACIRNRLWSYLTTNGLIDTSIQKGFWPKISGVREHVEMSKHVLKSQKRHNRDIYIVLLDLKNAFGEVHHSLIRFVLQHYHLPQPTIDLIMDTYSDFQVCITSFQTNLLTPQIPVRRGVLQGDTLSPLLFNLVTSDSTLHFHYRTDRGRR